ncbi:hypothetical protein [Caldicellulosiruptor acetigenus]|nr:hypothetical protein [Caldicellulosiruptor acetigenus]
MNEILKVFGKRLSVLKKYYNIRQAGDKCYERIAQDKRADL